MKPPISTLSPVWTKARVLMLPNRPGASAPQYLPPVFKALVTSDPPQTIISLPVHTAVCPSRASGALVILVAVQLFVVGLYLPPVLKTWNGEETYPPQTIITVPLQTAVPPVGALAVLVGVQLSVVGLYLPPVFRKPPSALRHQTIISVPVHTAVCRPRLVGALVVLVAIQLSVPGLYLPPVLGTPVPLLPQTIISLPVQMAVWNHPPAGALVVLVAVQVSVLGLYLPPVFKRIRCSPPTKWPPPQTIISLPLQTAVCRRPATGALVMLVGVQAS